MAADNSIYDHLAESWWDPHGRLHFLHAGLGPARVGYFRRVLGDRGLLGTGARALDIGCGGGLLAEPMAAAGIEVIGIDPSLPSLATAARHGAEAGASVRYAAGRAEELPVADGSVDVVFCCDVLEHLDDIGPAVAEIARVLRPGGVFCFDTVNRTLVSWLVAVKILQEWRPLRVVPRGTHSHRQFVRPVELTAALAGSGLQLGGLVGFSPTVPPTRAVATVRALRAAATDRMDQVELGRRLGIRESRDLAASYGGYAVRAS